MNTWNYKNHEQSPYDMCKGCGDSCRIGEDFCHVCRSKEKFRGFYCQYAGCKQAGVLLSADKAIKKDQMQFCSIHCYEAFRKVEQYE